MTFWLLLKVLKYAHGTTRDQVKSYVNTIACVETGFLLLFVVIVFLIQWYVNRRHEVRGKWTEHVARPINTFIEWFIAAIVLWMFFYLLMAIPEMPEGVERHRNVAANLLQNSTTLALVGMYTVLVAPDLQDDTTNRPATSSVIWSWLLVILVVTLLEVLTTYQMHIVSDSVEKRNAPFNLFSGVAQGLALFLIMGRFEEHIIWDHVFPDRLKISGPDVNKHAPLLVLVLLCGYAYGALQSTYPVLDQEKFYLLNPGIIALAFLLKAVFCVIVVVLAFRKKSSRPSALEQYLYETERFSAEDLQSYGRAFMRRHVDPNFRRSNSVAGYMGIEHCRISPYRRPFYGLLKDQDGFLITDVYPGSPAMKAGLRPGDYVTRIHERPIGPLSTLKNALEKTRDREKVRITFYRAIQNPAGNEPQRSQHMCIMKLVAYSKLPHQRMVRLSQPLLGLTIEHNDPDRGAFVSWKDPAPDSHGVVYAIRRSVFQDSIVVPDVHGLRQARPRLLPGEPLELRIRGKEPLQVRNGPFDEGTTVPWKPVFQDTPEVCTIKQTWSPLRLDAEHEKLIEHYPDRFVHGEVANYATARDGSTGFPEWNGAMKKGVVYAFDKRLELVFEYYYQDNEIGSLGEWPVWRKVTAGKIHLFIGEPPEGVDDDFGDKVWKSRKGVFCTVRLCRTMNAS